jgi:mannose-6-phosphate isomerase-like protein (cupin superfamily)
VRREQAPPGVLNVFDYRGRFFRVLQETDRSQTAVMTIAPGADSGPEEEHHGDQVIYVVEGEAVLRVGEREHRVGPGSLVTIPARSRHHVRNPAATPLLLLTVYAPPQY